MKRISYTREALDSGTRPKKLKKNTHKGKYCIVHKRQPPLFLHLIQYSSTTILEQNKQKCVYVCMYVLDS